MGNPPRDPATSPLAYGDPYVFIGLVSFTDGTLHYVLHDTIPHAAAMKRVEVALATTIDEYSLATVPVEQFFGDTILGHATAFVWKHGEQNYLITNWHVVTGRNSETGANLHPQGGRPNRLRLFFNPAQMALGKIEAHQELHDEAGNPVWLVHAVHRRAVDVVAIPLPLQPAHLHYRPINAMSSDALQVSVGMDVFILGYPFGYQPPGFPVWKRGSIASEPQLAPLTHRYMLVDSASRPGMSGAPVIRRSWGNHMLENDNVAMGTGSATRFLGVYSGRLHTNDHNDPKLARVWPQSLLEEIVQVPSYDTLD